MGVPQSRPETAECVNCKKTVNPSRMSSSDCPYCKVSYKEKVEYCNTCYNFTCRYPNQCQR